MGTTPEVLLGRYELGRMLGAAIGPPAPGSPPAPAAVTTSIPRTDPRLGPTVVRRGRETAAADQETPPMPWARVPGDLWPGGAGPGGRPGRLARAVHAGQLRSRRRTTWLLGLALGLVALLALPLVISRYSGDGGGSPPATTTAAGGGNSATSAVKQVRLPDLRGERLDAATAKLRALDLEVVVLRGRGGGRRAVVVSMSPQPDSAVDRGSTVQLQVGRSGSDRGGDGNNEGG